MAGVALVVRRVRFHRVAAFLCAPLTTRSMSRTEAGAANKLRSNSASIPVWAAISSDRRNTCAKSRGWCFIL